MVGLRTQEDIRFLPFFEKIQNEADKTNSVFFLDCGEGNSTFTDDIICTNCSGWLIPEEKSKEFEEQFKSFAELDDKWEDFSAWVTWSGTADNPDIKIELL